MLSQVKDYLSPARTALIVWDVQERLLASIFNREDFLKKASQLVSVARTKGISIFDNSAAVKVRVKGALGHVERNEV